MGRNASRSLNFTYPVGDRTLIGVRYFTAGPLSHRRREVWHSVPGGCNRARTKDRGGQRMAYKIWEQEVYRDEEGQDWMHLNNSKGTKYNGWSPVHACTTCHDQYIDDILADDEWTVEAACSGLFDVGNWMSSDQKLLSVQNAIEICNTCPVMVECGDWGERLHRIVPQYGTYGGETESERSRRIEN